MLALDFSKLQQIFEQALRFVEWDFGCRERRMARIRWGLGGRMVAPRTGGIKIGNHGRRTVGADFLNKRLLNLQAR